MLHLLAVEQPLCCEDVKLYSLMVPPLTKKTVKRRYAYLISALVKVAVTVALIVVLCVGFYSVSAIVVASLNCAFIALSSLLDFIVFASCPAELMLCFLTNVVKEEWFTTAFSYRHRLCVIVNRAILLATGLAATLFAAPPSADWQFLDERENIRLAVTLYSILLIGAGTPLITQFLWTSKTFSLWNLCAILRLAIGLAILSVGNRCINHRTYILSGNDPTFSVLPKPLQTQSSTLFGIIIGNAFFVGGCAYVGFLLSVIAGWTRSKKWVYWNMHYLIPVTLVLCATFISSTHIQAIIHMFCNYELIFSHSEGYPPKSKFADHICSTIRVNPRMNGQHWMTGALVILNCIQFTMALMMCLRSEYQPAEWRAADKLVLASLKEDIPLYTEEEEEQQLEKFMACTGEQLEGTENLRTRRSR